MFIKMNEGVSDGPSISSEEFESAERLLAERDVTIHQSLLEHSKDGARALFKTAAEIPQEVIELLKDRNHLGRVAIGQALY